MIGIRYDQYPGEIGGGIGYPNPVTDYDIEVTTFNQLRDASANASDGDVIWVGSDIYWKSGNPVRFTQNNLTLASDRNTSILCDDWDGQGIKLETPMLQFRGDNVRLSGVILDGQVPPGSSPSHGDLRPRPTGAQFTGRHPEIDNCIIRRWAAGIHLTHGQHGAHVHHNTFYENAMGGLGYGILHAYGTFTDWENRSVIEYNISDGDRHFVPTCHSYSEIRDNYIDNQTSHAIDVRARPQATGEPCGNTFIHHNELHNEYRLLAVRGVPTIEARVENNWTAWDSEPCANDNYWGNSCVIVQPYSDRAPDFHNVFINGNQFGGDPPDHDTPTEPETDMTEYRFKIGYHVANWLSYALTVKSDTEPRGMTSQEDKYFKASNYTIENVDEDTYLITGRTGTANPDGPMYGDGFVWQNEGGHGILHWETDLDTDYYTELNGEEVDMSELIQVVDEPVEEEPVEEDPVVDDPDPVDEEPVEEDPVEEPVEEEPVEEEPTVKERLVEIRDKINAVLDRL